MTIDSPPARQPKDNTRIALMMAAPALVGLLLFVALPFLLAVILSFTNLRLGSPLPSSFWGLNSIVEFGSIRTFGRLCSIMVCSRW
jgi:multiple sugar transport system permease protein